MYDDALDRGGHILPRTGQFPEVRQVAHYPELDWPVIAMAKEFPAQTRSGKHSHERGQLLFAVKGLMVANTAAGTWLVPQGHALWMPAKLTHDVSMHGDVSMRTAYVRAADAARLSAECRVLKVGVLLGSMLSELAQEVRNYSLSAVLQDCERIYHTTLKVLARAQLEDAPPNTVANQMAEEQFTMVRTRFDVTASQPCFTLTS